VGVWGSATSSAPPPRPAAAAGVRVQDEHDIGAGLRRVIADQSGYYVIEYQPPPGTFEAEGNRGPKCRRVEV
jgi:hypothetical protein